ncbi:MAG: hypothetical protein ACT4QE_09615 [Anaerolineales bacterium]
MRFSLAALRRGRTLVMVGMVLFGLSTLFPIVASLRDATQFPVWVGVVDVTLAFVLVGWLILAGALTQGKHDDTAERLSFCVALGAAQLLLVLLAIFFAAGDQVKWDVLLPGLAWRAWLLITALPAAFTLWRTGSTS